MLQSAASSNVWGTPAGDGTGSVNSIFTTAYFLYGGFFVEAPATATGRPETHSLSFN